MKKCTLLFLFIFFLHWSGFAQWNIFKMMFESLKNISYYSYMTPEANDKNAYGDGASYTMEAILRMYDQTNELAYIEDFVYISHEIIKNRDDFRGNNRKIPVWSTYSRMNDCYGPITHQTALILIPFAHYCYISEKINKKQFNELYFDKEFITFDGAYIRNLYEYSVWLEDRMMETVEYYDQYYWHKDSCMIQYADDSCETRYNIEGTDRQMNWGYLYLYLALNNQGTEMGTYYLNKYESIICNFRSILEEHSNRSKITYYLWPESGWSSNKNGKYEDISHAGAAIDLIHFSFLHKDFIQQYSQNRCSFPTFFSNLELQKFANTFKYNVYNSPLKYHNAIDGSCYFWRFPTNCDAYDFSMDYGVARWISLSKNEIHNQLSDAQAYYFMISDYYSSFLYRPERFFSGSMGLNLLGLANTALVKNPLMPVGMFSLDSLGYDIKDVTIMNGTINILKENQFSLIQFQDKNNNRELKFDIRPNTKKFENDNHLINFSNIGYEANIIPFTKWEDGLTPCFSDRVIFNL